MAVNYNLNNVNVLRDLYRLLTIIGADSFIAREFAVGDPLIDLRNKFMKDELLHLLVSTAVMNRLHEDHGAIDVVTTDICGRLIPDFPDGPTLDLTFRDACNKIIHADDITHEVDDWAEASGAAVLPNTLALRGRYREKHWRAYLWLTRYIRESAKNFAVGSPEL